MSTANLAIRFLLEVVGLVSLAYWGYHTPSGTPAKLGLAVAAPVLLMVAWAFVVAPKADNPLPQNFRMLVGSGLLLLSAWALAAAGQTRLAGIVAAAIVVNTILLLLFGEAGTAAG
ncbi:MAG TPA: YrdB family protein [Acidimicrobiia bacterium]|nr:YrdB family protein [Acidimicrobiia bacterium]